MDLKNLSIKILLTLFLALATLVTKAEDAVYIKLNTGETIVEKLAKITDLSFDEKESALNINIGGEVTTLPVLYIESIVYGDMPGALTVIYGDMVQVINPFHFEGMNVSINGGYVTLTNSNTDTERTISLTGTTSKGAFTYNGEYKTTIELNGVNITSAKGAAIDIECGKRIALNLLKGTNNTLVDAKGGKQKAALYCKGHLEVDKTGTLNVTGNTAHAISAKEYIQFKKSNGTINVLGAVKDGIHCKQFFLSNGYTFNIAGAGDDGIQVEKDGEANEEGYDDGSLNIQGGTYTIQVDSVSTAALKADSTININSSKSVPVFNITTTGNACKGISGNGDINISAGTFTFTQTGSYTFDGTDMSYVTAIKADKDINITGGEITIKNTADGGKGLSADGNVNISGSATVLDITANSNGGAAKVNIAENTSGTTTEVVKSYKVYVALPTSGGSSQFNPGGPGGSSQSSYWKTLYLYNSNGTRIATLTATKTLTSGINTKTFYYYDFKATDEGTYYFASDDYTSRSWGGSSTYAIKSTTFTGPTSGQDYYYEIASSKTTSGSSYIFTLSNVTNTWNGAENNSDATGEAYKSFGIKADGNVVIDEGTITINNGTGTIARGIAGKNITTNGGTLKITNGGTGFKGTNDSYTAKGLKANENVMLNAGTITIQMSGDGGKGIDCEGYYTQGTKGGNGPTLIVSTTGGAFGSSTSTGGNRPGGGMQSSTGSSAKAIKAEGTAIVYGGTSCITTTSDGAEGLESKISVTIAGGNHYFKCYDDCINSSGQITFAGGNTVCYAYGNDGVDSNYGKTGAISIAGGNVFAYTTKGTPEEGLDCDNNSFITITGGIAVSAGGAQGGGASSNVGSATQGYYLGSSPSSYGTSYYYTLCNTAGTPMCTYKFEGSCSNSLSLLTAPNLGKGSITVKYSTTPPTACDASVKNANGTEVFFINPTISTTGTTTTVTAK